MPWLLAVKEIDAAAAEIARGCHGLMTRPQILTAGGTDDMVSARLGSGRWKAVHPGVYALGLDPATWRGELAAAVLAGNGGAASHRAALVLWGLDGLRRAPLEVTVPITCGPMPRGVIVHRTRRPVPLEVVDGVTVTSIERTIIDAAGCLPPLLVEKAFESALRHDLTTPGRLFTAISQQGGRGVRGSGFIRKMLADRPSGRPAGSPAEVELIHHMRRAGIEAPVRQFELTLPDGTVCVIDFVWPDLWKASRWTASMPMPTPKLWIQISDGKTAS